MSKITLSILITIELLVCFFWPVYLLLVSMTMGVWGIFAVFEGNFGGLMYLGFSALGTAGLYGIFQVHIKLFKPSNIVEKPWVILMCLVAGVIGVVISYFLLQPVEGLDHLLYVLPLLATGHYLYMLRGYLFSSSS